MLITVHFQPSPQNCQATGFGMVTAPAHTRAMGLTAATSHELAFYKYISDDRKKSFIIFLFLSDLNAS